MKHRDVIKKMTVYEKAAILSGASEWTTREIKRLGISSIFFSDGPHGIRRQAGAGDHLGLNPSLKATCFPTAATIANSWDEELGEEIGRALGEEAAAQGVNVLLGPGLNIKRSPLCGRNFEYFSEDPYLAGKMAAAYIRGIQSRGVYACPKHFAVNSQELRRMAMNAVLDERTLREIYLTGFEIAVKEGGAKAIMSSYNKVNGTYANENEHLLKDILRDEWGFDGIVITDWGGSNDHVKGVAARSNVEMPAPGLDSARQILKALKSRELSMKELDECVDDLLDAIFALTKNETRDVAFDKKEHHKLARKAAAQSIVLLKNESDPEPILPLKKNCTTALIGDFAITPRYQGAGSSMVNPTKVETMQDLIQKYPISYIGCAAGYRRTGEKDPDLEKEALKLAQQADVILYCFGLDEISEAEGMDRRHMRIPQNQIDLLAKLAEVNPNIVGILSAGSAIEMQWDGYCRGLLHGYLGGQAGAGAMLDVICGRVNPSGRLSETYPVKYEDTPAYHYFPSAERNSEYRESIYIGYRFYDRTKTEVKYPFGYGLSYTDFEYSDLSVTDHEASCTVTNIGKSAGAEVVQMYVGAPKDKIFRPDKELKAFQKIYLEPGESRKVVFTFDDKTFRYWNIKTNAWEIEQGQYIIYVGANVQDIRLSKHMILNGTTAVMPYAAGDMSGYFSGNVQDQISDAEFEMLLGHPIPSGAWTGELTLNDAVCQMYYAKSRLARLIYKILTKQKLKNEKQGKPDLNLLFIYNIPFRGIAKMTGGMVSMEMAEGIVAVVNGYFFRGIKKIATGYLKNISQNKKYEALLLSGGKAAGRRYKK